ncbi:RAD55 family ATPase [Melittangium boletus]|uniref:RAD55 family ATPase n=1 Tax=Melittangium boletus TaxID=83453 RepID=UPI003DA28768
MSQIDTSEEAPRRVATGCAGLDTLLHGGWLHGGTYMVTGAPGTGKTVLGNQLCFSHVEGGGRAVFVTMLSESHGRMMSHLRGMTFFQREVIGQSLHYVSGYATLKAEGLEGLSRLLYRAVREHQATVLVVDGLLAAQEVAASVLVFREFLHALGVHNALAGCTTLVLTNRTSNAADPQFAMVDGVVVLEMHREGLQAVREVEVTKLRGDAQLTGRHGFEITSRGLVVYPRVEALYPEPPEEPEAPPARLGFGLGPLDAMLDGGLPTHSTTLLCGVPGSGKTMLGLHFLAEGVRQGEPSLYYGFMETRARLLAKARGVDLLPESALEQGLLAVETRSSVEVLADARAHELLALVKRQRTRRLFLDGLSPILAPMPPARAFAFITSLLSVLRGHGVTTLLTQRTPLLFERTSPGPPEGLEALIDNLVLLRYVEQRPPVHRLLSILKMRESDYDSSQREFTISAAGIAMTRQGARP